MTNKEFDVQYALGLVPLEARRLLVENPSTSAHILRALSFDTHSDIREAVAIHRNTPVDVLEEMSSRGQEISRVLCFVARNPNTPVQTLVKLSLRRNAYIQIAVAQQKRFPDNSLRDLYPRCKRRSRRAVIDALQKRKLWPLQ